MFQKEGSTEQMSLKSLKQHFCPERIHADLIQILKYVCIIRLHAAAASRCLRSNPTESYLENTHTLYKGRLGQTEAASNLESAESNPSSDCRSPDGAQGVRRAAHAVGARRGPSADPGAPNNESFPGQREELRRSYKYILKCSEVERCNSGVAAPLGQ